MKPLINILCCSWLFLCLAFACGTPDADYRSGLIQRARTKMIMANIDPSTASEEVWRQYLGAEIDSDDVLKGLIGITVPQALWMYGFVQSLGLLGRGKDNLAILTAKEATMKEKAMAGLALVTPIPHTPSRVLDIKRKQEAERLLGTINGSGGSGDTAKAA